MALASYEIYQGDTGVVVNATPKDADGNNYDVTDGNWTCQITVSEKAGDTPVVDRAVIDTTGDTYSFIAYVTPTETGALAEGTYLQVVQVTNTTIVPEFNLEKHLLLKILPQGAS